MTREEKIAKICMALTEIAMFHDSDIFDTFEKGWSLLWLKIEECGWSSLSRAELDVLYNWLDDEWDLNGLNL